MSHADRIASITLREGSYNELKRTSIKIRIRGRAQ